MGKLDKPICLNSVDEYGWASDISPCRKCCTHKDFSELQCSISQEVFEIIGSISNLKEDDREIVQQVLLDLIESSKHDDILMGLHPDIVQGIDFRNLQYFALLGARTDMKR